MEVIMGGRYAIQLALAMWQSGAGLYSMAASQVALGEADAVILRNGPSAARMLRGLLGLMADYRVDPGRCMPPLDAGVLAIINELVVAVPELDMTDRAILAHAPADPDSVFFITNDGMMLGNDAIVRYEERPRAQGRRNVKLEVIGPNETYRVS